MWDQRYCEPGFAFGTDPNDFLRQKAPTLGQGKVLCLAEGEGRNAVWLAQQGFDVTAVDASPVGLQKAQVLAAERGVTIKTVVADLEGFDPGQSQWDGIVSIFCHLPEALRKKVHAQVVTALKPGGIFILEAYTPRQLEFATGGPPVAELMMDLKMLRKELSALEFFHALELEREVIEGKHHHGMGAVVQLVAKKVDA